MQWQRHHGQTQVGGMPPQTPSTGAESQGSLQEPSVASKKGRIEKQGRSTKAGTILTDKQPGAHRESIPKTFRHIDSFVV
jgi:hypothetical protein